MLILEYFHFISVEKTCSLVTKHVLFNFAAYSVEAEHTGFRRVAGYGVTISRGAASALMFAYATILLTMCRNTITLLRETFFHKFIPFDAAISFHKYIAIWALFFTCECVIEK